MASIYRILINCYMHSLEKKVFCRLLEIFQTRHAGFYKLLVFFLLYELVFHYLVNFS